MVTTPIKQEVKIRKKMFEVCGFPVVARVSETSRRDKEKWRRIFIFICNQLSWLQLNKKWNRLRSMIKL